MGKHEEEPYAFYVLKDNRYRNVYLRRFEKDLFGRVLPVFTTDLAEAHPLGLDKQSAINARYLLLPFCPTLSVVLINRTFATYTYTETGY